MKRSRSEATRVCFDDRPDTIITPQKATYQKDTSGFEDNNTTTWYTSFEIAHFKRQNEQMKRTLGRIDAVAYANPASWSAALRRLHTACCKLATADQVVQVLQQAPSYPFTDTTLGMERQGIPSIAQCVLRRRSELYATVLALQYVQHDGVSDQQRTQRMRQASCNISHAAVLYARLLAEIVAATISQRFLVDLTTTETTSKKTMAALSTSPTSILPSNMEERVAANEAEDEEDDFTPLPF